MAININKDTIEVVMKKSTGDLRRAEPYVGEDGIYMPIHDYIYDGGPAEYKMIITKELFQEAFKEYIIKEGLNVQGKE